MLMGWWQTMNQTALINSYNHLNSAELGVDVAWWPTPYIAGNFPATVPAAQLAQTILKNHMLIGTVWLMIPYNYGKDNTNKSRQYMLDAVSSLQSFGLDVGVGSSADYWETTFGDFSNPNLVSLPVLYWGGDDQDNFDDWPQNQFGGWVKPTQKMQSMGPGCSSTDRTTYVADGE
jgi:hypothetical protein